MTTASLSSLASATYIRKINLTQDLDAVADLIELCFPIHLDQDGQDYIREMRKAARDMPLAGWLSTLVEMGSTQSSGFVWEENGRILGNLSLIPFNSSRLPFHMIANVAVHPDYRRRGIARALTERALSYLRRNKEPFVWLQVREDNPAAIDLYRSVGFVEKIRRTTWRIRPFEMTSAGTQGNLPVTVRRRNKQDWAAQQHWLKKSYPRMMRWNLPVNFERFEPGVLQGLANLMDGAFHRHWAFELDRQLEGIITWQKTDRYANNLWLAFPEEREEEILDQAIRLALGRVSRRHPLSLDYPKGQSEVILAEIGFKTFRTLVWMHCIL